MFSVIVVPRDASEQTEYALPLAVALARQLGDRALLLSVVPDLDELYALRSEFRS